MKGPVCINPCPDHEPGLRQTTRLGAVGLGFSVQEDPRSARERIRTWNATPTEDAKDTEKNLSLCDLGGDRRGGNAATCSLERLMPPRCARSTTPASASRLRA